MFILPISSSIEIPPLTPATIAYLDRFFDAYEALNNNQMFEAWISLNQALQTEYDLHRSLFNYWIYTNTEINGLQFAPYGFEYCDGEKVVTYFVAKNQKKIKHLSLEQANIAIESPTKLYHKLGIINLDTL